jgi:hypothetical protein
LPGHLRPGPWRTAPPGRGRVAHRAHPPQAPPQPRAAHPPGPTSPRNTASVTRGWTCTRYASLRTPPVVTVISTRCPEGRPGTRTASGPDVDRERALEGAQHPRQGGQLAAGGRAVPGEAAAGGETAVRMKARDAARPPGEEDGAGEGGIPARPRAGLHRQRERGSAGDERSRGDVVHDDDRGQLPRGRQAAAREPRPDRPEPGPRRGGQNVGIGGTQGPWSAHVAPCCRFPARLTADPAVFRRVRGEGNRTSSTAIRIPALSWHF